MLNPRMPLPAVQDGEMMLSELSLFSGYCGLTLGLRLAGVEVRTVGYVEIDPHCQQIIKARIRDGLLDDAPIWADVSSFDGHQCRGLVDIVTGGFPCQDVSTAGQRAGIDGERTGLWREMCRVIGEVGPRWVLLENVPGILVCGGAGAVIGELANLGYDCRWGLVPAAAIGAPHLRWRWWCLANAGSGGCQTSRTVDGLWRANPPAGSGEYGGSQAVANDDRKGQPQLCGVGTHAATPGRDESDSDGWWAVEPRMGRVADGVAHRVDRLRACGNGVVPAVVAEFLRLLGDS